MIISRFVPQTLTVNRERPASVKSVAEVKNEMEEDDVRSDMKSVPIEQGNECNRIWNTLDRLIY